MSDEKHWYVFVLLRYDEKTYLGVTQTSPEKYLQSIIGRIFKGNTYEFNFVFDNFLGIVDVPSLTMFRDVPIIELSQLTYDEMKNEAISQAHKWDVEGVIGSVKYRKETYWYVYHSINDETNEEKTSYYRQVG
jgi:hypothetical protein